MNQELKEALLKYFKDIRAFGKHHHSKMKDSKLFRKTPPRKLEEAVHYSNIDKIIKLLESKQDGRTR